MHAHIVQTYSCIVSIDECMYVIIYSIHSFISDNYIAPLQEIYREALLIPARRKREKVLGGDVAYRLHTSHINVPSFVRHLSVASTACGSHLQHQFCERSTRFSYKIQTYTVSAGGVFSILC